MTWSCVRKHFPPPFPGENPDPLKASGFLEGSQTPAGGGEGVAGVVAICRGPGPDTAHPEEYHGGFLPNR